ncbi:mechanosensitive ion channel family protein [Vibrio sp.]|uniref:Mechanosensitive ion channel family protein n=1 Tax=Vibrio viridaestus TaxID=2487322 RepID=A0A3N9TMA0_9VIBR|nr:mechanosensitive ion channel family protein [Vibrio viridaestus]MDC0610560.1 mechanosensitive ion channel family protein [Vibrio sp.]RQW65134.1 mechanosensitive ion channel family protein [Vibrio viridaestus]
MSQLEAFGTYVWGSKPLLTVVILLVLFIVRRIVLSQIRGEAAFITEKQRKWMSRTKNGSFALLLLLMFFLWKEEINEFALSVTAIAVAIVVASKEIILCFTGSIQRASSRSFRIGDWIEVGAISGEVIEYNMMATVIQEIDLTRGKYDYTGKTATLPNSMFFTFPVKNLNFMKRYVYHGFDIVVRDFVNLYPLFPLLHERIDQHFAHFIDVAKRYNGMIEKHVGVDLPGPEAQISVQSNINGEQTVHIMLFCPTDKALTIEQDIRKDFMELYEERFAQA